MEALLTTDAAATRLGVHRKTVLRYIQSGKLKATKLGRDYRIGEGALRALLAHPPTQPEATPRLAVVTAIVNQKGGVGKTTTTINVGVALHRRGRRVLLVDMDPQAALTVGIGIPVTSLEQSVYQVLCDEDIKPEGVIRRSPSGADVLPATLDLAAAEVELQVVPGRDLVLRQILAPLKPSYDHILIDTPPSLGLLTLNALGAADRVVVPVQCEFLAARGLKHLQSTLHKVQARLNPALEIATILPTIFDRRIGNSNDVLRDLQQAFPGLVFPVPIKDSARAKEAPALGVSIFDHDPRGEVAQAYARLAEVLDHGEA